MCLDSYNLVSCTLKKKGRPVINAVGLGKGPQPKEIHFKKFIRYLSIYCI